MSQFDNLTQENKDFLKLIGQIEANNAPAAKPAKAAPAVDTTPTEAEGA